MSQLRLVKPSSVFKNVLRHTNVRMISSVPTYPFMLIDYLINIKDSTRDRRVELPYEYPPPNGCEQKRVLITDSKLQNEVSDAMTIGFSRLSKFDISYITDGDDKSKHILIKHKPSNPEIKDVSVSLPPLPSGSTIQNIAMSCLPVRDKDWVVGVKLAGSRLSLCRPFGNRKWINVEAMPESISPFSSLMFSKKKQKFYVPSSPGGEHFFSLDLDFKEEAYPQFIYMEFDDLPKSVVGELENVSPYSTTDHFVESPGGELFLVKWYGEDFEDYDKDGLRSLMHKTKQFMVFRAEVSSYPAKTMIYTEDIGDLCIFLGHGEALCVPASSSPGLRPNCIYFVGYNFGVYDLTTKTCTTFLKEENHKTGRGSLLRELEFPYWPCPLPLD